MDRVEEYFRTKEENFYPEMHSSTADIDCIDTADFGFSRDFLGLETCKLLSAKLKSCIRVTSSAHESERSTDIFFACASLQRQRRAYSWQLEDGAWMESRERGSAAL